MNKVFSPSVHALSLLQHLSPVPHYVLVGMYEKHSLPSSLELSKSPLNTRICTQTPAMLGSSCLRLYHLIRTHTFAQS